MSGDGDDTSMTAICSKSGGQPNWNTTSSTAYYPDGSVSATRSPSERAAGVSTTFTYDADGDPLTVTAHHGCTSSSCASGITQNWYDGEDRLIETSIPKDTTNPNDIPWIVRNLYDLTSGGVPSALSGISVTAHGNVFETQKSAPGRFIDTAVVGYDALDRHAVEYGFAPCPAGASAGAVYCNNASYRTTLSWDGGSALGFLTSATDGLSETKSYAYDALGSTTAVQYAGDGGVTPAMSYAYDADGRIAQSTAGTVGPETYAYDSRGDLSSVRQAAAVGGGTTTYDRYGDSSLSAVSVSDPLLQQTNLLAYSYRIDGLLQQRQVNYGASSSALAYAYTNGGRPSQSTDFGATPALHASYDTSGRVKTYNIPAGTYDGIQYDAEGDVVGYTGYNGEAVSQTYDVRGDLVAEGFTPNPLTSGYTAWPAFTYQNIQGVTVQSGTQQWDGMTGALLGSSTTYDGIGRATSFNGNPFSYDAEDRLISGGTNSVKVTGNCGSGSAPRTTLEGYVSKYVYGPNGRVAQSVLHDRFRAGVDTTRTWHWNGDGLLYTNNASSLDQVVPDGLGVIPPGGASPGLTISDQDPNGSQASRHNATGYGIWFAPNPMGQQCVSETPGAASAGFVDVSLPITVSFAGTIDDGTNTLDGAGIQTLPAAVMSLTPQQGSQYASNDRRPSMNKAQCGDPGTADLPQCAGGGGYPSGNPMPNVGPPNLPPIGRVVIHPHPKPPVKPPAPAKVDCHALAAGQTPGMSFSSWLSGVGTAGSMTSQWALGVGPTTTTFGPDSVQSQQMMRAYGLATSVSDYLNGGASVGRQDFGLHGLWSTGMNPTAQFVGSYAYNMSRSGGNLNIVIMNRTTMWSAFYHPSFLSPDPPTRTGWSPMGAVSQAFYITVPCR